MRLDIEAVIETFLIVIIAKEYRKDIVKNVVDCSYLTFF